MSTSARRSANFPQGVSRTSIQEDFERILNELKLEKYKTTVKQELTLDLRENRRVKSEAAAFLDLHRSSFFHRLRVLEIGFAKLVGSGQQIDILGRKMARPVESRARDRTRRGGPPGRDRGAGDRLQVQDSARKEHVDRRSRQHGPRRLPVRHDGFDGTGPPTPSGAFHGNAPHFRRSLTPRSSWARSCLMATCDSSIPHRCSR